MAVDLHAVDFFHVIGEEFSDVFVSRPVNRNAQIIAILGLERGFQIFTVEPVFAEPIEVGKLLIGQLIQLAIRPGGELDAHEIGQIKAGVGGGSPRSRHLIGQVIGLLQARMGADQVRVVDITVIQVPVGLHLGLNRLHNFAFAQNLVIYLDAGDFLKRFGQHFGFVGMGRNAFRQYVDFHACKRLCRFDEPIHFGRLLFF